MPRITRSSSTQEDVVDVVSSPEKDDERSKVKQEVIDTSKPRQHHPQSQCVMIVPGNQLHVCLFLLYHGNHFFIVYAKDCMLESKHLSVVTLRNPRTATGSLYAFSHHNTNVYEINQFDETKR